MNHYLYVPCPPAIYPYFPHHHKHRNYYPINLHYSSPPCFNYHCYTNPIYSNDKISYDFDANYFRSKRIPGDVILWKRSGSGSYWKLTNQGNNTVSLQNLGNSRFKGWYLDIDGNTGKSILSERLFSGCYWKLTNHGNNTVSLQNLGNSSFKGWYLDIDGNTGKVILWERLGSGGYWKLTDQGNHTVILQNLGNSSFKDWYLDIDATPAENIAERAILICISGRAGAGKGGISNLREKLVRELGPLGVKPANIIRARWNYSQDDDPFGAPSIKELLKEIEMRNTKPSYLAIIGHSYGGWAACKLSRVTSRVPDFVGLIDAVFGSTNTFTNGDIPRGNFIKNWYQNNSILGGEPCTGIGKTPCTSANNGISCGYNNIPGVHENINEHFLKDSDGNRKRVSCIGGRVHLLTSHTNIDDDEWIHRQIRDQIYTDLSRII
ncbi:fascin domain-containing protein [Bacillus sp. FSL R9-9410]|uniref:fascin domain-containing protein n=1 Tax=Bacillus sp. FSL R9-9410 TaxID=2921590 RepID=UPI001F9AF064|nr:RICIN domain-containing protein [Bacillus mycoides]